MNHVALRSEPLNILSICTGGAGLDLGVELAIPSARTVCMVEREAFSVATLVSAMEQGHLHPAPVWSDARTFSGRPWRGAVDGLIGGIPCQPHSLAGRKQGSNDSRDLWSTARRIIVQSGAWFVVIENVGGMLSAGSDEIAGAQRVFRDLHKLGFETEGGLFTAAEVGASHQRERIFILAVADPRRRQLRGRTRSGGFLQEARGSEGQGDQRERDGDALSGGSSSVSGVGLADAYSERLEGVGTDDRESRREDARRSVGLCDRATVVDPESIGRRKGRAEPELRSGRATAPLASGPMADAKRAERWAIQRHRNALCYREENGRVKRTGRPEFRGDEALFPPGPFGIEQWRDILTRSPELEPAFRRVADGMASRLDIARVTDFACSATELSHFKQRMRSALLSLGLPREAPPAQLALFG